MTELSKFINLLIEFEEKIEGHLNKKYKPFIRKIINLDTLAKNVDPNRIKLTKELIVFKLGLEAKSHKAIEISLNYLLKMFELKFVDLNMPNYCELYAIEQGGIKEREEPPPKEEVRHLLISLLRHCLNYKKHQIYELIIRVLQNLITEPILDLILDAIVEHPQPTTSRLLFNFFSFRAHIYEQICLYSEAEMKSFHTLTIPSERVEKQIRRANDQHQLLSNLISRYMVQYLSIIDGIGGRYGLCVICGQPAEHFCKITKASLCGIDCKKKHIEIAQVQYKHQFQASHLWSSIYESFRDFFVFLQNHEHPLAFGVLSSLMEKPYLFMVAKKQFRSLVGRHVPIVLGKLLKYRNDSATFENIYIFMASLTKNWLFECITPIDFFFREYIIKVLEDKKPSFRFLNYVFKALAKILQKGKVTIQLYVNFDCELNKENILQKVLFELAKIAQDRFSQTPLLSKVEKQNVKNHCLTLFIIMSIGLNQYRKQESREADTSEIVQLKQRKMSMEQFVVRFNEHWTSGLKTLYNLNLVGLDSNQQIVDIFLHIRGLKKENLQQYFGCERGEELFNIFTDKIFARHKGILLPTLIDIFHYLPLKPGSVCLKKFTQKFKSQYALPDEKQFDVITQFLCGNYNEIDFTNFFTKRSETEKLPHQLQDLYAWSLQTRAPLTVGNAKTYFTYCCSRNYLEVIANQLALLQIPISYLLQNDYEVERLLNLTEELVQICPHSHWLSLLIKNSSLTQYPSQEFDEIKMKIVVGILNIMEKQAHFIQNWSLIITFLSQLNHIFQLVYAKKIVEGRVALSQRLNVGLIERCLMEAGSKCDIYFGKLLFALISVGKEETEREVLFMTHKFFELIDANPKKFLGVVDEFMPILGSFCKHMENLSGQLCISVVDMLKQTFAKLLKVPKSNNYWINGAEPQFWQLFQALGTHKNKEVSDFVVNCITMTLLHHYDIGYKSWIVIFAFMKGFFKLYRQQIYTIVEKILSQKMRNCEDFYPDLVDICLGLVDPEEVKLSHQALHSLKTVLEITSGFKIPNSEVDSQNSGFTELANLLMRVEKGLIDSIFYNCHEDIMDNFFKFLRLKVHDRPVLSPQQVDFLIEALLVKVQGYDENTLQIAEKTINFTLGWSVNHKYSGVVSLFEKMVVNKYTALSLSVVKCIKTYVQMVNPQTREQWKHIESSLLSIARNTRISDQLSLDLKDKYLAYQDPVIFQDRQLRVDLSYFSNNMVIQKAVVQILPNHLECLQEVSLLFHQVTAFNDNLYLRCLLWRRGLGSFDHENPPNLLSLEEAIAGKLVAIYSSAKEGSIVEFSLQVFDKYCKTSAFLSELTAYLSQGGDLQVENATVLTNYLKDRRIPLTRVMGYFLPKYQKFCQSREERKKVVIQLVECLKYVDNREPFLRAIRDLTKE